MLQVFDDAISEKWKQEALATRDRDLTPNMMRWVIDELRYKAKGFEKTGALAVPLGLWPVEGAGSRADNTRKRHRGVSKRGGDPSTTGE